MRTLFKINQIHLVFTFIVCFSVFFNIFSFAQSSIHSHEHSPSPSTSVTPESIDLLCEGTAPIISVALQADYSLFQFLNEDILEIEEYPIN